MTHQPPAQHWHPDLAALPGPKYLALARALKEAVAGGTLPKGCQLPPVRDLAWRIGVTPGTVARAYQMATQEGLLEAVVGRGTFVAAERPQLGPSQPIHAEREESQHLVDLRSPGMPDLGQTEAISAALARLSQDAAPCWLDYPRLKRDARTRAAVVDWLACRDLGAVTPDDIVLTHGGQSGLNIALQCCLRGERPVVFVEELAYPGIRHAARLLRAEVQPVALDSHGMRPDALAQAARQVPGQVVVLTPEAQNPTTARMGLVRRQEILAVARAHDLQIIEDDCFTVPRSDLPTLRALGPERGWHIASLSKNFAAGLRFGAIACPTGRGEAGRLAAQHGFFGLSRPLLDLVTDLMESGEVARLRGLVNAEFARRLRLLVAALEGFAVNWQEGLPFVWLRLPTGWRASTFCREAEAEGVLLRSADEYALIDSGAPAAVRIALAGGIAEERFLAALATLRRLLENPPGDLPV